MLNIDKNILIVSLLLIGFQINLYADYLFLKDGTHKKGKIENRNTISVVFNREGSAEKETIPIYLIHRIVAKPLVFDKVIIHKKDNAKIVGWLVDYDDKSYTFRNEQNMNSEFHIDVNDVLFFETAITPRGITGKSTTSCISLQWKEPEQKVQSYRIYFKTREQELFQIAGNTNKTEYDISGLKGNTAYCVIVKSLNSEGFESLPGKILDSSTLNNPPSKPGEIRSSINKRIISLSWNPSNDSDGKVMGYAIYRCAGDECEKVSTINKSEVSYTMKNLALNNRFSIKAIDDVNTESEASTTEDLYVQYLNISASAGYVSPIGEFGKLYGMGMGASLTFSLNNYLFYGLVIGAEAGYYSFNSGNDYKNTTYNEFTAAPMIVYSGYRLLFVDSIIVEPMMGAGYCYAMMTYNISNQKYSEAEITPVVKAGMNILYVRGVLSAGIGLYYSRILENKQTWSMMMLNIGAGLML